jgi:hypothetical protein
MQANFLPSSKPKAENGVYLTSERKRHKQNKREEKWLHTYLYKTAFVQARERR